MVNASPQLRKQTVQVRMEKSEIYSGPLPHPAMLEEYDRILPGGADRIFTVFEKQSAHRQEMETTFLNHRANESKLGTICITVISIVMIVSGAMLIYSGKDASGLALIGTNVVVIGFGYIRGTSQSKKNLENKKD